MFTTLLLLFEVSCTAILLSHSFFFSFSSYLSHETNRIALMNSIVEAIGFAFTHMFCDVRIGVKIIIIIIYDLIIIMKATKVRREKIPKCLNGNLFNDCPIHVISNKQMHS